MPDDLAATLRGFYRPSGADPALDVLTAARAARSLPAVTSAALTFTNEGLPAPGGVYDDALFGAAGERAARIDLVAPVVHRALAAAIAACLSLPEADVWRIAYSEAYAGRKRVEPVPADVDPTPLLPRTGPDGLRALLARAPADRLPPALAAAGFRPVDLLLDVALVVPPVDRPLERAEGGALMPGAGSARYQVLLVTQARLANARAYPMPKIVIHGLHRELQTAFEALCVQFGPERAAPDEILPARREGVGFRRSDRLVRPRTPPAPRLDVAVDCAWVRRAPPDESALPSACAFAGDDRIVVGFGYVLAEVSIPGGALTLHPVAGTDLVTVSPDGRLATLLSGGAMRVLDLEEKRWVAVPPRDLPLVSVGTEESAEVIDVGRGVRWEPFEAAGFPMTRLALSPDGAHLWAEERDSAGGIYALDTGLRRFDVASEATRKWGWAERNDYQPLRRYESAFVLDGDRRWRFFFADELLVDGQRRWRSPAPVCAAAFSRGGDRLVAVSAERIRVLSLAGATPRVVGDLSLRPLAAAVAGRVRVPAGVRHAVLCRYGTLAAAAAAPRGELLAIPGVGPARVATIQEAARAQRIPARLRPAARGGRER